MKKVASLITILAILFISCGFILTVVHHNSNIVKPRNRTKLICQKTGEKLNDDSVVQLITEFIIEDQKIIYYQDKNVVQFFDRKTFNKYVGNFVVKDANIIDDKEEMKIIINFPIAKLIDKNIIQDYDSIKNSYEKNGYSCFDEGHY